MIAPRGRVADKAEHGMGGAAGAHVGGGGRALGQQQRHTLHEQEPLGVQRRVRGRVGGSTRVRGKRRRTADKKNTGLLRTPAPLPGPYPAVGVG
jgi:hypothetical protein